MPAASPARTACFLLVLTAAALSSAALPVAALADDAPARLDKPRWIEAECLPLWVGLQRLAGEGDLSPPRLGVARLSWSNRERLPHRGSQL